MARVACREPRRRDAEAQLAKAMAWMADHQLPGPMPAPGTIPASGVASTRDFRSTFSSSHETLPNQKSLAAGADEDLHSIGRAPGQESATGLSQLAAFAMFSLAERLSPGAIYRRSPPSR